jgi:hypothetical protein
MTRTHATTHLVFLFCVAALAACKSEADAYATAKQGDTIESWTAYLNEYPQGEHAAQAQEQVEAKQQEKVSSILERQREPLVACRKEALALLMRSAQLTLDRIGDLPSANDLKDKSNSQLRDQLAKLERSEAQADGLKRRGEAKDAECISNAKNAAAADFAKAGLDATELDKHWAAWVATAKVSR